MIEANKKQIEDFKKEYCRSDDRRLSINEHFDVEIDSHEELLPGNTVKSYASGNREIDGAFIVFKVKDTTNEIIYYPVFSYSVGSKLAKEWGLSIPRKMTVFTNVGNGDREAYGMHGHTVCRKEENRKMLQLIQFARSMMILHITEPEPMKEPFKGIYDKLEKHPNYDVFESDIKSVNTALLRFFANAINIRNENFMNLQQYIDYLQRKYPEQQLRNYDFEVLRNKMMQRYPSERIVF